MSVLQEVLAANEEYAASFGAKGDLALPPARGFAILTCMDARLDPAKYAGLSEGDAHVIRNAGGRASDDAIRSLVISYKLLGTAEWFVIHHTNCGMEFFTDEVMRGLLARASRPPRSAPTASTTSAPGPARARRSTSTGSRSRHAQQSVVEDVDAHPAPPARARRDPDLRLHLRRQDGTPGRGRGRDRRGPGHVALHSAHGSGQRWRTVGA